MLLLSILYPVGHSPTWTPAFTVGTGCAYFRLIIFSSTVLQIFFALVQFSGEEKCSMYNFFYSLLGIRQPGSLYSQWRQAVPIFAYILDISLFTSAHILPMPFECRS